MRLEKCQYSLVSLTMPVSPPPHRALEKRLARVTSECEVEVEQRRLKEAKGLELEKALALAKLSTRDNLRRIEEVQEAKEQVSTNWSRGQGNRCALFGVLVVHV